MEYTRTIEIKVGDKVECLTPDGFEWGRVTETLEGSIKAYMDYVGEEREYDISLVRF